MSAKHAYLVELRLNCCDFCITWDKSQQGAGVWVRGSQSCGLCGALRLALSMAKAANYEQQQQQQQQKQKQQQQRQ